jgi:hypothetical protein
VSLREREREKRQRLRNIDTVREIKKRRKPKREMYRAFKRNKKTER